MSIGTKLHPVFTLLFFLVLCVQTPFSQVSWRQILRQDAEWYGSEEALGIADQVLLYQLDIGGWDKNIDMGIPLTDEEKEKRIQQKSDKRNATIDNGATFTQLRYLAQVYEQAKKERFKTAFEKGVGFLLDMQYENGGFPQFPFQDGYKLHITYNDNAMIGVLNLLHEIAAGESPFAFVDEELSRRSRVAVEKGIDCILKTQVEVEGVKTAWCAQHDRKTLQPAPARTYEKISLSGAESVNIVRFLMSIPQPNEAIIHAIESAVSWLERVKLTGIKVVRKEDSSLPRGYDRVVVEDKDASPIWARFYQIGTNKPIFSGRDGIIKATLAEIEHERRVGYSWYTDNPEDLLTEDYPAWKARLD